LKGWATGRETQRGPKSAREQAVSREKSPFCQMKGTILRAWHRAVPGPPHNWLRFRWLPIAAQFGSNLGSQGRSWTVLIDEI
jgi:hypothetical protein